MKLIGGRHTIFVTGNQGIKKLLDFGEKFVFYLSTLLACLTFLYSHNVYHKGKYHHKLDICCLVE